MAPPDGWTASTAADTYRNADGAITLTVGTGNPEPGQTVADRVRINRGSESADRATDPAVDRPITLAGEPGILWSFACGDEAGVAANTIHDGLGYRLTLRAPADEAAELEPLFGHDLAEQPLALITLMREVANGTIGPEEAVRAYHGELQKAGTPPARSLEEDRLITEDALKPAASARAVGTGRLLSARSQRTLLDPGTVGLGGPTRTCPATICVHHTEQRHYGLGIDVEDGWIKQDPSFAGYSAVQAYLPGRDIAIAVAATRGRTTTEVNAARTVADRIATLLTGPDNP